MDFRRLTLWEQEAGIVICTNKIDGLENARMGFHAEADHFKSVMDQLRESVRTLDSVKSREDQLDDTVEQFQEFLGRNKQCSMSEV